jgi:transposase
VIIGAANRHDSIFLDDLLKKRILVPQDKNQIQHVCLDAGYVGKSKLVIEHGFIPHIRSRGEEKKQIEKGSNFKARRWIVEVSHSWFNRFRKLIPRYEKTTASYEALTRLAAAMIILNKVIVIYG